MVDKREINHKGRFSNLLPSFAHNQGEVEIEQGNEQPLPRRPLSNPERQENKVRPLSLHFWIIFLM